MRSISALSMTARPGQLVGRRPLTCDCDAAHVAAAAKPRMDASASVNLLMIGPSPIQRLVNERMLRGLWHQ
jgi:hypothetical protein